MQATSLVYRLRLIFRDDVPSQVKDMAVAAPTQPPPPVEAADVKPEPPEIAAPPEAAVGAVKVEPAMTDAGHQPAVSNGNTEGSLATLSTGSK